MMPNRIKELRAKNRMLQDTLARKVGLTQQAISKIENDKSVPYVDVMIDISKIFNVSLDYLMCLTNEYKKLEYNDKLDQLAGQHNELLNMLSLLEQDDIDTVYLFVHALVEKKLKNSGKKD